MKYKKSLTVKFISRLIICAIVAQHSCIPILHILQNAIITVYVINSPSRIKGNSTN